MKIAFCASDNNASSGAFLSMANLAKQLNKKGVETLIILPPDGGYVGPGDGVEVLKEMGLRYILLPSVTWIIPVDFKKTISERIKRVKYNLLNKKSAIVLSKILKKEKIDILHINTIYSYFGFYAARLAHIPVVWHIREFLEEDQNTKMWNKRYAYSLLRKADKVIAISKSIYKKYAMKIGRRNLRIIYNGVDNEKFYIKNRKILQSDKLKIVYVGGLSEGKGILDLLDACKKLDEEGYKDKIEVTIAGRGTEEFQNLIKKRILDEKLDNVKYIGYQKDVVKVMTEGDVSLVTSKQEAFGRVTVEAMLTGNLVLGADSAGTAELVRDGKRGILYKCGNPADMSEKIKFIINNKNICCEMAEIGQKYMNTHMTAKINSENIYKLYMEILDKKKGEKV